MKKLLERCHSRLVAIGTATCMVASAASAGIDLSSDSDCQAIQALKSRYLHCEFLAQAERLDTAEIAGCSETYHRLKAQVFQDDFARIREWYEITVRLRGLDAFSVAAAEQQNGRLSCS
ncbi:MAG: hypothetical protein HKN98_09600 [Silicimonas sp.]|nr:hypothetical protein [Silicimonas sp.]NNL48826.1 hypothetical protein [Acidimicrobiia bacterium]